MNKILIAFVVLLAFNTLGIAAEVDPACVEHVKSICLKAWQDAAKNVDDIEFVCREQDNIKDLTSRGASIVATASEWQISCLAAKKRRLVNHIYPDRNEQGLHVANDQYKFTVAKSNKDQSDKPRLTNASKYDANNGFANVG